MWCGVVWCGVVWCVRVVLGGGEVLLICEVGDGVFLSLFKGNGCSSNLPVKKQQ